MAILFLQLNVTHVISFFILWEFHIIISCYPNLIISWSLHICSSHCSSSYSPSKNERILTENKTNEWTILLLHRSPLSKTPYLHVIGIWSYNVSPSMHFCLLSFACNCSLLQWVIGLVQDFWYSNNAWHSAKLLSHTMLFPQIMENLRLWFDRTSSFTLSALWRSQMG